MTQEEAIARVIGAAREMAQIRSDDPDKSKEEEKEIEELWEAIELLDTGVV